MTGKDARTSPTLYPHSTDFTNRPGPPEGGYSWEQIEEAIGKQLAKVIEHVLSTRGTGTDLLSTVGTNSLHALRRTDKGQYEYEQWQAQIDFTKYNNVGKYIAFTVLGWPDLRDPADTDTEVAGGINRTLEEHQECYRTTEPRLTLRINHYPFPVQESIQYFVLWATRDMSVLQERERLDLYLKQQFEGLTPDLLPPAPGKKKQWMWFVNPVELRSVATVHHLHVFVRDIDL